MLHSQQAVTQYRHTDVTEHLRCQLQLTASFTDWSLYSELLQCTLREVPTPALGAPTPAGPSVGPPAQPSPGSVSHFTQDSVNATSSESLPDHTFWGQPAPTITLCPFTHSPFCGLHSLQLPDLKGFFSSIPLSPSCELHEGRGFVLLPPIFRTQHLVRMGLSVSIY